MSDGPSTFPKIDHLKAIESAEYRAEIIDRMEHLPDKYVGTCTVLHENDSSCCKRESWHVTFAKIIAPVTGRNELDLAALLAEHEPAGVIVRRRVN